LGEKDFCQETLTKRIIQLVKKPLQKPFYQKLVTIMNYWRIQHEQICINSSSSSIAIFLGYFSSCLQTEQVYAIAIATAFAALVGFVLLLKHQKAGEEN
jgi:hypothetical protein